MNRHPETLIVGAGPFGLGLAAYFRKRNHSFRLVGKAVELWKRHMPAGMLLRSGVDWHLDPDGYWTLERFLAERNESPAGPQHRVGAPELAAADRVHDQVELRQPLPPAVGAVVDRVIDAVGANRVVLARRSRSPDLGPEALGDLRRRDADPPAAAWIRTFSPGRSDP